jgi:hypothetical protein
MDYPTFKSLITNLFLFYQRKPPMEKQINMWFSKTNSIPPEAGKWIIAWITNRSDGVPWNVTKAILDGWRQYKKENPQKIISGRQCHRCNDCYGEGIFWFKKFNYEMNGYYEYACRCGSCENWRRHVGALALPVKLTLAQLKEMNVEIVGRVENNEFIGADACEVPMIAGPS